MGAKIITKTDQQMEDRMIAVSGDPERADTLAKAAPAASADSSPAKAEPSNVQPMLIQRLRPVDSRGINVYEAPKNDGIPYTGFKLGWGAAFTQQFQGLEHSNTADAVIKKLAAPASQAA